MFYLAFVDDAIIIVSASVAIIAVIIVIVAFFEVINESAKTHRTKR